MYQSNLKDYSDTDTRQSAVAKQKISKYSYQTSNSSIEILQSQQIWLSLPSHIAEIGSIDGHIQRSVFRHTPPCETWTLSQNGLLECSENMPLLACNRMQRRDTYRWGLFSFFHKPTESKPSHRGKRSNKASLFFLCSLTSNY